MSAYWLDWLSLLTRWAHLIVGIAWIGASFYFVWLDNHLDAPTDAALKDKGVAGELWAVHGGGFYNPQKYRLGPPQMPSQLHWFYWEAYSTWLTGFAMLVLVYFLDPALNLLDPARAAPAGFAGVAVALGFIVGGWLVYDGLCRSPLAKAGWMFQAVLALVLAQAAFALCWLFSGRGAFILFGAMLGTMMVANVAMVIIPGQRRMVAAIARGDTPNPVDAQRGKQRSVHNTYFTLPVLLTMISNHYAGITHAAHNALALVLLAAGGAAIRHWFVLRHRARERAGRTSPVALVLGVLLIAITAVLVQPPRVVGAAVDDARALAILDTRCVTCHAEHPTFPGMAAAPNGAMFDSLERARAKRSLIATLVQSGAMPPGNLTGLSDDERAALLRWAQAR
jgi:uncharacterized membrane protein